MDINISNLLAECITRGASDLHLSANCPPMLRIDGELRKLDLSILSNECIKTLADTLMTEKQSACFGCDKEMDFAFSHPVHGRFRANFFYQYRGISCVLRRIPDVIPGASQLNLPEPIMTFAMKPQGLVLVCGATGSGKSTTLAAMIQHLNVSVHKHILTIEDPIEYLYQPDKCLIQQRQVGEDTLSFHAALRAGLREDPDIILIGELRDLETIRLALTAAETGHLVLATLHTRSAARAVDRIVDVFPPEEQGRVVTQLADSLQAVIAQQLLPLKNGGRIGCFEILVSTPAIANLIRERRGVQIDSMIQTGGAYGMSTMAQSKQRLLALNYDLIDD